MSDEIDLSPIRDLIREYGWAVMGIFPDHPDEIGFAYTVGLTAAGLPELVISGPYGELAKAMLNTAAFIHIKSPFTHGDTVENEALSSTPLRIIDAQRAEVNVAKSLFGESRVKAVQLVWPSPNGLWPGSPLVHIAGQELFGEPWWDQPFG